MRSRPSRPRRLGILTEVTSGPVRRRVPPYPYGVGDRIDGDLTIIGHLARGRIGHLYQVWSATGWCALTCKILAPSLREDREAIATLRREARILRRLRHPNLIRGFGGGEHEGLPYILMEYLAGPSLFDVLEARPERRLGLTDAIRAALHIGAALQHLHQSGYLYLDLKPANLMLRNQVPILVDFDTVLPIRAGRRCTRRPGTAPYMAPEQVRGEALTPSADIYGLGAVLYEMLTGRWPFEAVFAGEEEREDPDERTYPQLGNEPPTPPSSWNDAVPAELDELVLRSLAPKPEDRFPTLHSFLLELAAQLEEPGSLWPGGVEVERRRAPRQPGEQGALPVPEASLRVGERPEVGPGD